MRHLDSGGTVQHRMSLDRDRKVMPGFTGDRGQPTHGHLLLRFAQRKVFPKVAPVKVIDVGKWIELTRAEALFENRTYLPLIVIRPALSRDEPIVRIKLD